MQPPHILIQVDSWFGVIVLAATITPFGIAAAAGAYLLAADVLRRVGRTVLGTHIRHFFTRIAPAKRFHASDHDYVRHIMDDIRKREVDLAEQTLRRGH